MDGFVSSYIDDKYAVLDGVLISAEDKANSLVIPAEIGGIRIRKIASGFYPGKYAKTIMISEGIESIGDHAFVSARELEKVILPESLKEIEGYCFDSDFIYKEPCDYYLKRELTPEEYTIVLDNSISLSAGGLRLLTSGHAVLDKFSKIYKCFSWYKVPQRLDESMQGINITSNYDLKAKGVTIDEKPFSESMRIRKSAEDYRKDFRLLYIKALLGSKVHFKPDSDSEALHDRNVQVSNQGYPEKVLLTEFDEKGVVEKDGMFHATFHIYMNYAFFGTLTRVVYSGRDYYVYRENYLRRVNDGSDYLCMDQPDYIVDSEGNVPPENIRKIVSAKYRLPSMLS